MIKLTRFDFSKEGNNSLDYYISVHVDMTGYEWISALGVSSLKIVMTTRLVCLANHENSQSPGGWHKWRLLKYYVNNKN